MTQNNSLQTSFVDTASASFPPTRPFGEHGGGTATPPVITFFNGQATTIALEPPVGVSMDDRIARLERNPQRRAALERARARIGQWMDREEIPGSALAALRLQAGLSQRELAQRMNTQQSNISRLEKQPDDPKLSTLEGLAAALSVPLSTVIAAVKQHQAAALPDLES